MIWHHHHHNNNSYHNNINSNKNNNNVPTKHSWHRSVEFVPQLLTTKPLEDNAVWNQTISCANPCQIRYDLMAAFTQPIQRYRRKVSRS